MFKSPVRKLWSTRLKSLTILVSIVAITFICYQILSLQKLNDELRHSAEGVDRLTKKDPHIYRNKDKLTGTPKSIVGRGWEAVRGMFSNNSLINMNITKGKLLGVEKGKLDFYKPDPDGMFSCIQSGKKILWTKVNDDYCDCESDGSDEPSTSACTNGVFYCTSVINSSPSRIPSSRVGDGICDCCDGSDEWQGRTVKLRIDALKQKKLGRFLTPCSNRCSS